MSYDHQKDKFKGRIPPQVWDHERLEVWDNHKLQGLEIQSMAPALSADEVLSYYNLEEGDLPPYDLFFFNTHYNRGRLVAKQNAAAKLFESMNGGDHKAALSYLTRFGHDDWRRESSTSAEPGKNEIRVILDGT